MNRRYHMRECGYIDVRSVAVEIKLQQIRSKIHTFIYKNKTYEEEQICTNKKSWERKS